MSQYTLEFKHCKTRKSCRGEKKHAVLKIPHPFLRLKLMSIGIIHEARCSSQKKLEKGPLLGIENQVQVHQAKLLNHCTKQQATHYTNM